jgi:hypothetical protein
MALLSNALVAVRNVSARCCYSVLFVLLIADMFLPYSLFNSVSFESKILLSGAWVAMPVFFSGLIFSGSLKNSERVSEALGINLFGAVCGGVLENAVMIGGTPVLTRIAVMLYVLSVVSLVAFRRPKLNNSR